MKRKKGRSHLLVARLNGGEDSSITTVNVVVRMRNHQARHINHNWLLAKEGNFPLFAVLLGFPTAGDNLSLMREEHGQSTSWHRQGLHQPSLLGQVTEPLKYRSLHRTGLLARHGMRTATILHHALHQLTGQSVTSWCFGPCLLIWRAVVAASSLHD